MPMCNAAQTAGGTVPGVPLDIEFKAALRAAGDMYPHLFLRKETVVPARETWVAP